MSVRGLHKYLSVRFIFRISEATLMVFLWLVKVRADFGSAQNIQLLDRFFARTELLALAGVESLVLVDQKRDPHNQGQKQLRNSE